MSTPRPGPQPLIPSLLAYLPTHPSLAQSPPPDPLVFSAILLNLIVNTGGLIIDVPRGTDRKRKQKASRHVADICTSVFGRSVREVEMGQMEVEDVGAALCVLEGDEGGRDKQKKGGVDTDGYGREASHNVNEHNENSDARHQKRRDVAAIGHDHHGDDTPEPSTTPRIAQTVIMTDLALLSPPALIRLLNILITRRIVFPSSLNTPIPAAPDRPIPPASATQPDGSDQPVPSPPSVEENLPFPPNFMLVWIREAGTQLPGWMIDQFSSSIFIYPSDLPSMPSRLHSRAPSPDSTNPSSDPTLPPITAKYIYNIQRLLPFTHIHPPLSIHISNLFSATSSHPRLTSTLTSKAHNAFPLFVKAHRLISASVPLPQYWEEALDRRDLIQSTEEKENTSSVTGKIGKVGDAERERFGVGGGRGGVHTWARAAGEEPDVSELRLRAAYNDTAIAGGKVDCASQNDNDGADGEQGGEGWYATSDNVNGVWNLCIRHRVRARKKRGEIMWLMQGGAGDEVDSDVGGEKGLEREADRIMEDILHTV